MNDLCTGGKKTLVLLPLESLAQQGEKTTRWDNTHLNNIILRRRRIILLKS